MISTNVRRIFCKGPIPFLSTADDSFYLLGKRYAGSISQLLELRGEDSPDENFRTLVIPGHTLLPSSKRKETERQKRKALPPRYQDMDVQQDWTAVWPAAQTFKWSAVPLPIKQGFIKRASEGEGFPCKKYANTELIKIPNFLHLTPPHIKNHCESLKELCTEWPKGLKTDEDCDKYFPVNTITHDYVYDGPSIRDIRSRVVTVKVNLASLNLNYHAKDKLIRLSGDRYDKKTDTLTIVTDRCPLKKQNKDYAKYLLTAVYFEAWKTEAWENEKTEDDYECFNWNVSHSKTKIHESISQQKKAAIENEGGSHPLCLGSLPEEHSHESIDELPEVKEYSEARRTFMDEGESLKSYQNLKEAALKLLLPSIDNTIPVT